MGGETYRFDPANPSETKFPEYYDGKNFAYDFGRGWFRVLSVGSDGTLLGIEKFLDSSGIKQPINAEFGPDGSLHVLDYGTGLFRGDANSALYRIDYTRGNRLPVAKLEADHPAGITPLIVRFSSAGSADPEATPITLAWDLDGNGTTDSTEASPTFTDNAVG